MKCYFDPASVTGWSGTLAGTHFTVPAASAGGTRASFRSWLQYGGAWNGPGSESICDKTPGSTGSGDVEVWIGPTSVGAQLIPAGTLVLYCVDNEAVNGDLEPTSTATYSGMPAPGYELLQICPTTITTCVAGTHSARVSGSQLKWQNQVANLSAFTATNWPANWYPGGTDAIADPFCGTLVTSNRLNNEILEAGDQITFTITPFIGGVDSVDIAYHLTANGSAINNTWFNIYNAIQIGAGPFTKTLTVPPGTTPIRAGFISMRCYDTALDLYRYKKLEDAGIVNDPSAMKPCLLARFYWPKAKQLALGENSTWNLSYTGILPVGTATTITSISWAAVDRDDTAPVPDFASLTWTSVGSPPFVLGSTAAFTVAAPYAGPTSQFIWRCQDSAGYHYDAQWSVGVRSGGDSVDPGESEGSCIAQADIGFAPSSWVPGAAKIGSCIMRVLFVPSSAALEDLSTAANQALTKAPFSFIAEGVTVIVSGYNALEDSVSASSGNCFEGVGGGLTPDDVTGEINAVEICSSDFPTGFAILRPFLVWLFWLGFAWMILADTIKVFSV